MKSINPIILAAFLVGGFPALGATNSNAPDPITGLQQTLERLKTVAFRAVSEPVSTYTNTSQHGIFNSSTTTIAYDTASGSSYDNDELIYTIPADGLYRISATAIYGVDPNNSIYASDFQYSRIIVVNGTNRADLDAYSDVRNFSSAGVTVHTTDTVVLCAGDVIRFEQVVQTAPSGKFVNKRERLEILKVGDLPSTGTQ